MVGSKGVQERRVGELLELGRQITFMDIVLERNLQGTGTAQGPETYLDAQAWGKRPFSASQAKLGVDLGAWVSTGAPSDVAPLPPIHRSHSDKIPSGQGN